jgi:putative flippase GtrA
MEFMISRLHALAFGSARRIKLFRYTAGSVIAFATSEVVFIALFGPHILGARGSSIIASIAGIIPGYYLNRNWAWQRSGRSHPLREVAPYWITVIVSTLLAATAIGAVNDAAAEMSRGTRTIINAATYMAVYGVIFIAKFIIFNYVLFRHRPHPAPQKESEVTAC